MFSWLFGKKKPAKPEPAPPPRATEVDLSRTGLEQLFGKANVGTCINPRLKQVGELCNQATKFGGLPSYATPTDWPRCKVCKLPLMFIGQVEMGPKQAIYAASRRVLYIFLCQSDPTVGQQCETWDSTNGGSMRMFTQPYSDASELKHGETKFATEPKVGRAVHAYYEQPNEVATKGWKLITHMGHKEYLATMFGQYTAEPVEELSLCDQEPSGVRFGDAHYAALSQLRQHRAVFFGGYPDWVQAQETRKCQCGQEMTFLLQFTSFDPAINLGDAGKAYVFACPDECTNESFRLFWQCC